MNRQHFGSSPIYFYKKWKKKNFHTSSHCKKIAIITEFESEMCFQSCNNNVKTNIASDFLSDDTEALSLCGMMNHSVPQQCLVSQLKAFNYYTGNKHVNLFFKIVDFKKRLQRLSKWSWKSQQYNLQNTCLSVVHHWKWDYWHQNGFLWLGRPGSD